MRNSRDYIYTTLSYNQNKTFTTELRQENQLSQPNYGTISTNE